MKTILRG